MKDDTIPLISVIIPIFNVEKYLERCLDSVVHQTDSHIEIILVNDGSTDASLTIAQRFASQDERINLITTKNHGLSAARNTGKSFATGEYFTFIDSDDYVASDYVEYLWQLIAESNRPVKIAICSLMNVFPNGKKRDNGDHSRRLISGKDCIRMMCYHQLVDTCAYAKLASRELYEDVDFPVGRLFEDIGTTYQLLEKCDAVACGFDPKYFYVLRKNSIVNSTFSDKKLDLIKMTDQMANDVNQKFPDLVDATTRRQVYARFSTLNQTFDVKGVSIISLRKKIIKFINVHSKGVLQDSKSPIRDKIAIIVLKLGFPIYRIVWKTYLRMTKAV